MNTTEQIENWAFAEFTNEEICKMSDDSKDFVESIKSKNEQKLTHLFENAFLDIEPRHRYVLCRLLNENGFGNICEKNADEVYGVVFQVGLDSGAETLSVYPNREGWYINYTGKTIKLLPLSEKDDKMSVNPLIDMLIEIAGKTAPLLETRDYERIRAIANQNVRINFLTGSGLRSVEYKMSEIPSDSTVGVIFNIGTKILQILVKMSVG